MNWEQAEGMLKDETEKQFDAFLSTLMGEPKPDAEKK